MIGDKFKGNYPSMGKNIIHVESGDVLRVRPHEVGVFKKARKSSCDSLALMGS